jgi:hypothetical protein
MATATEIVHYRGYEPHVEPLGSGLKVFIRSSGGGGFARPEVPHSRDKSRREELIAEAKATVDALLDPPHVKKNVK